MYYARPRAVVLWVLLSVFAVSCSEAPTTVVSEEPEALDRTEFTERIENFFEYVPLNAGQPSEFRIHLTDLLDGSPVEGAEVVLTVYSSGSLNVITSTTALIARVAGIYVASLTILQAGTYDIEFHVKNAELDERMLLSDFIVEQS